MCVALLIATASEASDFQVQSVRIVADSGTVHLRATSTTQVQCECSTVQTEMVNDTLFIRAEKLPKDFTVTAPATTEMQVFLREGSVVSRGFEKAQSLRVQKGKILVPTAKGVVQAHVIRGDIEIEQVEGEVSTDSGFASVKLSKINGKASSQLFQGQLDAQNIQGRLNVASQSGTVKLTRMDGEGSVEANKASIFLSGVQGRLEASTTEGGIQTQFNQPADLVLKSQSGKIAVQVKGGLGPLVWAWSGSGEVSAPGGLKTTRDAFGKNVRGRIPASVATNSGSLTIRSNEGPIVFQ